MGQTRDLTAGIRSWPRDYWPFGSGTNLAASLFEIFPVRTEYEVRPNSIISFEFIVFTPAPEWGGAKVPVNVEENALITEHGIQWLYPPQDRVLLIR